MHRVFFAVLLFVLAAGAAHAGDAVAGKAHYDKLCVSCHGAGGKGDGPAAVALNPKPVNLTQSTLSDADMTNIIKNGGASVGKAAMMAPFGSSLNDADIANVVSYIRTLK